MLISPILIFSEQVVIMSESVVIYRKTRPSLLINPYCATFDNLFVEKKCASFESFYCSDVQIFVLILVFLAIIGSVLSDRSPKFVELDDMLKPKVLTELLAQETTGGIMSTM
jgi:hypothetical protein